MNILHATTEPPLLQRLKEMLGSSARADIAVGYFFVRGFEQVSAELGLRLRQRLTVYPEYIVHQQGFMAAALEPRLRAMVDEDGYPLDDEKGVAIP